MSYVSHFLSPLPSPREGSFIYEGSGEADFGDREVLGSKGRVLSLREQDALGMWAATMKVMAGTQMLLPPNPTFLPVIHVHLPRPRSRHHPTSSHPSAPPGSPIHTPSPHHTTTQAGILQEASAACTKMIRVAQALERRTNAERRISRGSRRRRASASGVRPAATSTVSSVGDNRSCRVATVRPPQLAPPPSVDLVGLVADVLLTSPPPAAIVDTDSLLHNPARTYVDAGIESRPILCNVSVDVTPPDLPRSFASVAVDTVDMPTDFHTTYGLISDPFARSLARLLPLELGREQKLARAIYLAEWRPWAEWFGSEHLPPTQRVYLNVLAEIFRPWQDPQQGHSLALGLNPVYNLFTHWWSGWNAVVFPGRPPERDPRLRYDFLSDAELHGEVPLSGRGFVVQHASGFY